MTAAHTPGPWRYKPGDKYAHVVGGNPEIGIADCAQDRPDSAEWQANARLIAAAPALAEALRELMATEYQATHCPQSEVMLADTRKRFESARAALKQAGVE